MTGSLWLSLPLGWNLLQLVPYGLEEVVVAAALRRGTLDNSAIPQSEDGAGGHGHADGSVLRGRCRYASC